MRIRTIKPEFFLHYALFKAERECNLPLRLAFSGLWCAADRDGRFKWEPERLKAQILPYDELEFSRVLDALATREFIVRYACGTRQFGVIPSFSRHQVINNRERPSELPEPPKGLLDKHIDACPTRDHACPTPLCNAQGEGKGREQGREGDIHIEPPAGFPASQESAKNYIGAVGCPPEFAMNLWNDLAAVGWKDGAGREISSFQHYLAKRWRESQQTQPRPSSAQGGASTQGPSESVKLIMAQKELERVESAIKRCRANVSESATGPLWTREQRAEMIGLQNRKKELLNLLGAKA